MSDGEKPLQQSTSSVDGSGGSMSGSMYEMRGSFSDSTSSASSGGNGYLASTSSSSAASSCSTSFPTNSAFTTTSASSGSNTMVAIKFAEDTPPPTDSKGEETTKMQQQQQHNTISDISIDTFHTPSTSLQNLSSQGGPSPRVNGSSGSGGNRKLDDLHDEPCEENGAQLQEQREEEQEQNEEDEDVVTDSGTASTSIPVTVKEFPDSPVHEKEVPTKSTRSKSEKSLEDGNSDNQNNTTSESSNVQHKPRHIQRHSQRQNKHHHHHHHKRQNSSGSHCSLSSNPESSQFKTAEAHSSDSDVSRTGGTTSGFAFEYCSSDYGAGESRTIKKKDDHDRKSLQSDSHSGDQLNTSVESVDSGHSKGDDHGRVRRSESVSSGNQSFSRVPASAVKSTGSSSVVSSPQGQGSGKPRVKKKMWYQQIFSTSYKTRSGDFKKIFKDLPSKERLIVDYSCALQKEILLQGRMYVSQNYVSFYANIFGWETQLSINFKEIESITKEKTALIIPNAIQICTMTEKFFFSSFVTRDATYVMLFRLWQSVLLEDNMSKKELWKLVHTCYGEELGVTSEDESEEMFCPPLVSTSSVTTLMTNSEVDGTRKSIEMDPEKAGKTTPEITIDKCNDDDNENEEDEDATPRIGSLGWCRSGAFSGLVCTGEIGPAIAVGLNIGSSIVTSNGIPIAADPILIKDANIVPVPVPVLPMTEVTDSSDTDANAESDTRKEVTTIPTPVPEAVDSGGDGEPSVPEEIPVCPVDHSSGKEMLNTVIPCNIDQLFTMLFTNSKFYLDFQLARKTCDINQSEWQLGDRSQKNRQLTFTVLTGQSLGPRTAQVTETQTLLPESRPGLLYTIQSESVNAGIPYADAFSVNCHYCLKKVSANEANIVVITKIHYKKSTWAKSFIERNSMSALTDFFTALEKALREECAKMNAGGVTPTSPVGSSMPVRRRHPRKKCRAPDIPVTALPRPIVETSVIHPVGSRQTIPVVVPEAMSETALDSSENSFAMKVILTVLGCLLLLNAFLYFKLSSLETAANLPTLYPATVQFSGETPQTHQEWLVLLQQQETLHRTEVQSWHEVLASAIKVLHQAEKDLENLKTHISTYGKNTIVAKPVIPAQDTLDLLSSIKSHSAGAESILSVRGVDSSSPENDSNNNKNVVGGGGDTTTTESAVS